MLCLCVFILFYLPLDIIVESRGSLDADGDDRVNHTTNNEQ